MGIQEHKKAKIMQVALGVIGTIIVALFIVSGPVIPPLYVLMDGDNPWAHFLGISSIFFFPPYFAVTGLISLFSPKTKEGEFNARDFMSSYAYTEKSKKAWIKHLAACMVGVINASLMWMLTVIRGL